MLRLFSDRSSHPLADPKSARELFERLEHADSFDVVDEVDSWLESTSHDVEIKPLRRVEVLFQLDDAGTAAAHKLVREYLRLAGDGDSRSHQLWEAVLRFWRQLAASYWVVLEQFQAEKKLQEEMRASLPAIQARLLRAQRGGLKWNQFRYGPVAPELWRGAGRLYLDAEKNRWLDKKVALGAGTSTTIAAEYLRLLLFHAASMNSLQPIEIELADQLLGFFLSGFSLTAQVRPENVYWIDAAKPLPPTRLAKLPEITPTLRFFTTATALSAIEAVREEMAVTQSISRALGLRQPFTADEVTKVLLHLKSFCSAQPPMRSHARLAVKSSMRVASGYQAAIAALRDDGADAAPWDVFDVSRGGMRAALTLEAGNEPGVGTLIAMCPEGGDNWLIGMVRRYHRESQSRGSAGIETVGRTPRIITFDSSGLAGEAVLLESALSPGSPALLVVAPDVWRDFKPLCFELGARAWRLRPLQVHRLGADYVIGRYWADAMP